MGLQTRQPLGVEMDSRSVQSKEAGGVDDPREVRHLSLRGLQGEGYRFPNATNNGKRSHCLYCKRDEEDCSLVAARIDASTVIPLT